MVKEKIGQRYCEDCGEIIWNRRADAKKCLECRRKAQKQASQKVKETEKRERILRKIRVTGVKFEIEEEKVKGILDNLKQGPKEDFNREKSEHTFSKELQEDPFRVSHNQTEERIRHAETQPFFDLIDEKVKEEKEKEEIKRKIKEKEKRKFLSFQ